MKKIRIISMVAAIAVFVFAALMITKVYDDQEKQKEEEKIKVVVATQNIAPFTEITDAMIEIKSVSDAVALPGYFSVTEDVVGKIAVGDIYAGEALTEARVVDRESDRLGLSNQVKKGMRAVTVSINPQSGVGYNLKVGNMVDVLMTKSVTSEFGSAGQTLTQMMGAQDPENSVVFHENMGNVLATLAIQNLKILALDRSYTYSQTVAAEGYSTVTLEVTPRQAEQIALINGNDGAAVLLTLRAQDDEEIISEPREDFLTYYR